MLSARIECRKRQQRVPRRKTLRVETVVRKALLAVVEDVPVVALVRSGDALVARHEGGVRRLQLEEDGQLLEALGGLACDVNSAEGLV